MLTKIFGLIKNKTKTKSNTTKKDKNKNFSLPKFSKLFNYLIIKL